MSIMADEHESESSESVPVKKAAKKKTAKRKGKKRTGVSSAGAEKARGTNYAFPQHTISKSLRVPTAILEQNAGKECTPKEASKFAGIGYNGDVAVEISSANKYGLLERPNPGFIKPTELVRRIVRPQTPSCDVSIGCPFDLDHRS